MEISVAFIAGMIASFIGVSVGGAGLILLPVLIFIGLNAKVAVATSAVSYIILSAIGLYKFHKHGKVDYKVGSTVTISLTIGAIIGSLLLVELPADLIKKVIAVFLLIITVFFFLNREKGIRRIHVSKLKKRFGHLIMVLIGIYKGAINSGSSLLTSYTLIHFYGLTYMESSATRKLPFLLSFIVSAVIYIQADIVNWPIAITLMAGNVIGGYLGVHYALKKGEVWMKYAFAVIVIVSAIKLMI